MMKRCFMIESLNQIRGLMAGCHNSRRYYLHAYPILLKE